MTPNPHPFLGGHCLAPQAADELPLQVLRALMGPEGRPARLGRGPDLVPGGLLVEPDADSDREAV